MARRQITRTKFGDQGKIIPEVVAVVSAKDKAVDLNNPQKYFKRNYIDALKPTIPPFYLAEERDVSGTQVSYPNQLINSHIIANTYQATILPVSSLGDDLNYSSIGTPEGFSVFFHKTYPPASIAPDDFERNILFKLNKSYNDFATSSAFQNYLVNTLLPSIPSLSDADINLATTTASAFDNTSSGTYSYLITNLGWLYFLNRNGSDNFTPSTAVASLMTDTLYRGQSVVLEDLINIYQEHLWKGQSTFGIEERIIPVDYVSALSVSSNTNTSGTQLLDRLKVLNTINYSPHYVDSADTKIEDSFTLFFDTSSELYTGTLITDTDGAGPLARFLQAMSFSFSDRLTEQDEIGILYDIGRCPDEFLELLAELIGWRFIGADVDKWRVQLRNAVEIYKMKGTRRSIQILLDTLFSTGAFNVTSSDTLSELWESYIPDIIYYSLATSSDAFKKLGSVYTEELATQFGIPHYDPNSMDTNIKYAVDKIMFDLVRDFPNSFILSGKNFPTPEFVFSGTTNVYEGAYHLMGTGASSSWMTGNVHEPSSALLELKYDPNFTFFYRGNLNYIPPYEKRQFYTQSHITDGMIDRIEFYLRCYGCDAAFAKSVTDYIRENTSTTISIDKVLNNFLLFTKSKTYPPNYATVLQDVTKQRTPDPATLLSMWNGKSSHFLMSLNASSFDFSDKSYAAHTSYGLSKIMPILDQVIPAHAIPEVLLSVSSVADALDALGDIDCREWRPNFDDLYEGSSTVTTGFGVCAVNMVSIAEANNIIPNRFKRTQVDNVNDVLLSGSTFQSAGIANRNSLRRRNYHNLLPETKMFTRNGRNNPGSLELSSPYYSSSVGYLPLGFMPSSLKYKEVALVQNMIGQGIGQLLSRRIDPVWDICQTLTSPSSMFGYDISNTFASRAKQDVASSDCNTYGRRGQLQEIMYVMNQLHDKEKYLQASSMVSGYYGEGGIINRAWPSSSTLITPNDLSSWYAEGGDLWEINVIGSIANQLINKESSDESLNYYEHFTFGSKVMRLYDVFNKLYKAHGTSNNYNLMGGANIYSHTYGPYLYNSNFDIDGSGLEASGYLSASSPIYEVDIAYHGGSGVLSISGVTGEYAVGTSAASSPADGYIGYPEFRNPNLVSGVELVDTSVGFTFSKHPIFSLFNMARDQQSKWSFNKTLINNQVIKYHRPSGDSSFPRIRIPIYPNSGHLSQNFLQPNHDYEINVTAHNLDISSLDIGGLTLGVWVHTEPEAGAIWSYNTPVQDRCGVTLERWTEHTLKELAGQPGISLATANSQTKPFRMGSLSNYAYSGDGGGTNAVYNTTKHCWEPWVIGANIPGSNPLSINNINSNSRENLKFRFSTKNNITINPSSRYRSAFGKVHRADQKYVIEIFVISGDDKKFVVFEEVSMIDITNQSLAKVESKYGDIDLTLGNLKAIFKYYKTLSRGIASRNAVNTSSIMEVSGGSRLNYRSNSSMFSPVINATWNQITEIEINEG